MIQDCEIEKRLNGAVDRVSMHPDRERMARYVVNLLIPEVKKIIREELRKEHSPAAQ
jgi:hypothetical protein